MGTECQTQHNLRSTGRRLSTPSVFHTAVIIACLRTHLPADGRLGQQTGSTDVNGHLAARSRASPAVSNTHLYSTSQVLSPHLSGDFPVGVPVSDGFLEDICVALWILRLVVAEKQRCAAVEREGGSRSVWWDRRHGGLDVAGRDLAAGVCRVGGR